MLLSAVCLTGQMAFPFTPHRQTIHPAEQVPASDCPMFDYGYGISALSYFSLASDHRSLIYHPFLSPYLSHGIILELR